MSLTIAHNRLLKSMDLTQETELQLYERLPRRRPRLRPLQGRDRQRRLQHQEVGAGELAPEL